MAPYVDVELPVKAPVDVEPVLELTTRKQALREHRGEEDGQGIVLSETRYLDGHVDPRILALGLVLVGAVAHVYIFWLAQGRQLACLFHFSLDANKGLCAILEGNARTSVCSGQDVILCAHGAKVAGPFGDIAADGGRLCQGPAQKEQLYGGEADEGVLGRHGGGWWWATWSLLVALLGAYFFALELRIAATPRSHG